MKNMNTDYDLNEVLKMMAFTGLSADDLHTMKALELLCERHYKRNAIIFKSGEITENLGIVVRGNVIVESVDYWGSKSILSSVLPGKVFGETYALSGHRLMIDARATEPSTIFLLNVKAIMSGQYDHYSWQHQMLKNLLLLSSRRGLTLSLHIFYITPKKIRERVSYYLSGMASSLGTTEFDIPFNREQFADFLNVDRSALSKELSCMQKEGLIEFRKNHFKLLELEHTEINTTR